MVRQGLILEVIRVRGAGVGGEGRQQTNAKAKQKENKCSKFCESKVNNQLVPQGV